tara:strand:- start:935 stop:1795 length:861 start_codon:yes stop_codon:yes gene_type:complete
MKHFWCIFIFITIIWSNGENRDVKHTIIKHKGESIECFIDSMGYEFLYFTLADSVDRDSLKIKDIYYTFSDLNRVFHYSWSFKENLRRVENRSGYLYTIHGDTIAFTDITFYNDMIMPEIFLKKNQENSTFISMFDIEKIETDYSIMSYSVKKGFLLSFYTFIGMTLIEIYGDWDEEKRIIPQFWSEFDDLMPMISIVGLRETGVTYQSFTSLIPITVLGSMIYDIVMDKNKFYFNPIYKENNFDRNMYVFSIKNIFSNQMKNVLYKIEGTKFGGKSIGWLRKKIN